MACTCGPEVFWRGRAPGAHLPQCPALEGRRGIRLGEERLMNHISMFGSDGYPIGKLGRGWVWLWSWDTVTGPPTVWKRKKDAVAYVEKFLDILHEAWAGRL
jgi:hypothetical protein